MRARVDVCYEERYESKYTAGVYDGSNESGGVMRNTETNTEES